jgi:NADH-quinone oxidoreductase subunit N
VLFRLLGYASDLKAYWQPVLSVIAGLTMLYGNLVALRQTDVKRILGYSSIGHAGYILVAILAHGVDPTQVGPNTLIYYMLAYSVSTVGAFAVIALAARDGQETTSVENLNGLFRRSPAAAASLVIFMASLMGIPLTGGFLGKALIFQDAMQAGLMPLAIILAVSSIISVSFYLRIAYAAVVPNDEQATTRLAPVRPALQSAFLLCAAAAFGTFVLFGPLITAIGDKAVGAR